MHTFLSWLAIFLPFSQQMLMPIVGDVHHNAGPTINAGFEFRGTSGYVATLPGDQFVSGIASCPTVSPCYPTTNTIGGFSTVYGWNPASFESGWLASCNGSSSGFDRNASVGDVRLAGIAGASGDCTSFGVVLASGSYDLVFAIGDANSGQGPMTIQIYDGASLLSTIVSSVSTGSAQWYDASGTLRASQSAWTTTGAVTVATVAMTGTKLGVKIDGSSGSAYISYFHITNH